MVEIYGGEASPCLNGHINKSGHSGSFWPIFRQAKISSKKWDKSNEPILQKNAAIMDELINQTILGLLGPFPYK